MKNIDVFTEKCRLLSLNKGSLKNLKFYELEFLAEELKMGIEEVINLIGYVIKNKVKI